MSSILLSVSQVFTFSLSFTGHRGYWRKDVWYIFCCCCIWNCSSPWHFGREQTLREHFFFFFNLKSWEPWESTCMLRFFFCRNHDWNKIQWIYLIAYMERQITTTIVQPQFQGHVQRTSIKDYRCLLCMINDLYHLRIILN